MDGLGVEGMILWTCEHCEGQLLSNKAPSDQCPFCGKQPDPTKDNAEDEDDEAAAPHIQYPALILPFTVPEQVARQRLASWLDPNILRPPGLAEGFDPVALHAVYLPYWIYDVYVEATWRGKAGHLHFDPSKPDPWEVDEIRYSDTGGYYAHTFQHMIFPVKKSTMTKFIAKLMEEEEYSDVIPYDPRYMEQFEYAVHNDDPEDATEAATEQINQQIEEAAGEDVNADFHHSVNMQLRMEGLSLRHVLIPLWIITWNYRGKAWHACIHGRTGEIEGDQPWSRPRVGFLIALICLIIFFGVLIFDKWVL
jgi:hypothetical protein